MIMFLVNKFLSGTSIAEITNLSMKEKPTVKAPINTWVIERMAIFDLQPLMFLEMNFNTSLFFISLSLNVRTYPPSGRKL